MLTLEQIKDAVATRYGFQNWSHMYQNTHISDKALENVVKIYSNQKLCAAAEFAEPYSEIVCDYILKLKGV